MSRPAHFLLQWLYMRKRNPKLITAGLFFVSAGILGLALPFISFGLSDDYSILQDTAEQKKAENFRDQFIDQGSAVNSPVPVPTDRPDPDLTNISNRLLMPQLGISMPIFESDSVNTLLKGGWIFPGTSTPDKGGNTVVFGHRFRYLPPISNTFYSLDKINIGDTFTVAWKGQLYTYKVREKKIIEPTDFSVLNKTSDAEITLITCAPLFSTKQRLVVVGTLVLGQ